ncbi:hypothetical protein HMPREF9374_1847 [Desmospora sp. 8437]|nr:hypothetical protein HMPREF9374_1847 [Desmospora sp. 8437]
MKGLIGPGIGSIEMVDSYKAQSSWEAFFQKCCEKVSEGGLGFTWSDFGSEEQRNGM